MDAKVEINRTDWFQLLRELYRRGKNKRESGAFLLAQQQVSLKAVRFVYYDDLDPCCLSSGYVHFDGAGYVRLWQICRDEKMRVVADVHTHPGRWTDQSSSDEHHPMVPQKGHLALIIPNYARWLRFTLKGVGIYEYLGEGVWQHWSARSGIVRIVNL